MSISSSLTGWARLVALSVVSGNFAIGARAAAEEAFDGPRDGTVGYVLTDLYWSIYQTPSGKEECPQGFNLGPREVYSQLFPSQRKVDIVESQLQIEGETWWPSRTADRVKFLAVQGKRAYGMNLDGKVGANDFTHPDGTPGIDNAVYRTVGCIVGFRGPDGTEFVFQNKAIRTYKFNRIVIELSGLDSWTNDDDVDVTIFRGRDRLLTDATGNRILPGGTQRIDLRWGRSLIRRAKGKIVNTVLTTSPIPEMILPWQKFSVPTYTLLRDMRLQLKLSPTGAEGLLAGYADVDTWYKQLMRNNNTYINDTSGISAPTLYKALRRHADAYPDPETGANTAISAALDAKFTQVFIQYPPGEADPLELLNSQHSSAPTGAAASKLESR